MGHNYNNKVIIDEDNDSDSTNLTLQLDIKIDMKNSFESIDLT
jgi:hypothetical protein